MNLDEVTDNLSFCESGCNISSVTVGSVPERKQSKQTVVYPLELKKKKNTKYSTVVF